MSPQDLYTIEVIINGLMTGVMYSLIALGFVLIFKASGIFNDAQGVMALFAALTLVGLQNGQVPFAHLINAIFGFWIEDVTAKWAAEGADYWGMYIDKLDIVAAVVALSLVVWLTVFSQYTKTGRALRAVADDHQAELSVGISLRTIWVIVWSIAGFVALVAGVMWGAKSGVQFSLSLIALEALPVLMLGGFTAIPGGLIIGVGEKLFEFGIGPMIGGATENWFAYVLALIFLVFRPQGLFGDKIFERV